MILETTGSWNSLERSAVLIPCFNDTDGLKATLDSLDGDCFFNVLIIDDGSAVRVSDSIDTGAYSFALTILRLTENSGIITALNTGLSFLLSKKVVNCFRLDCCDLHVKGRFEKQLKLADENGLFLVGGAVEFFGEDKKSIFTIILPSSDLDIKKKQCYRSCFIHPSVMINLTVLNDVGYYNHRYVHAEDYDFFFRVTKKYKVGNLEDVVVKCLVRQSGLSLSNRSGQIKSVLRSQLDNADWSNPYTYIGMVKTVLLFMIPRKFIEVIKTSFFNIYSEKK